MLLKLWKLLQGKKVYIVALATFIYAGIGLGLHFLTLDQAMPYFFTAAGAIGFRSAMKK